MKKVLFFTSILLFGFSVQAQDFFQKVKSNYSAQKTVDRLESLIKEKGLTHFTTISHSKGAKKVGLEMEETQLIIFGNPKVGTLLMQADIRMGEILPMKFLVWKENAEVFIGYTNPEKYLKEYKLKEQAGVILKVKNALGNLSKKAAE